MVLNLHPLAPHGAAFKVGVSHDFIVRQLKVREHGFVTGKEFRFSCQFLDPPAGKSGSQTVICIAPDGTRISGETGRTIVADSRGGNMKLFAGLRSDPFFLNTEKCFPSNRQEQELFSAIQSPNDIDGLNVLSIVLEINVKSLGNSTTESLFCLAAETTANDGRRLDRVGRPEVTNIWLGDEVGDIKEPEADNHHDDIRDIYNLDDTFSVSDEHKALYSQRLRAMTALYDVVDGQVDWTRTLADRFVAIAMDDYYVFDVFKPINDESYFEIERAVMDGREWKTFGGRTLGADAVDSAINILISRNEGNRRLRDGVSTPTKSADASFPYLAEPNQVKGAVSVSVTVDGSPDKVWRKFGKFGSISRWHPAIVSAEVSDNDSSLLRKRKITAVDGSKFVEQIESIDDKARHYEYSIVESTLPVKDYRARFEVKPGKDPNTSVVVWNADFLLNGAPRTPVRQKLEGMFRAGLENIAWICE